MKNKFVKDVFWGILLALVATYFYPAFFLIFNEGPRGGVVLFTVIPLYALLYTFWLVIPLGGGLGILIPQVAFGKTRWVAALLGAGVGIAVGLVYSICFISFFDSWSEWKTILPSMIIYCALWTSAYAFIRAKGHSPYR